MQPATNILVQRLKLLGDLTRLRLLALCRQGECSVSELTRVVGQSQPRVSQHLKQLCDVGLLRRFRDGRRVYYRIPARDGAAGDLNRLLALIPAEEPMLVEDLRQLLAYRGQGFGVAAVEREIEPGDRALHKALVELTVAAPIGDLLDVGCGRGSVLKLLASRARRAVGVDIDEGARLLARADLMLAGLPNCSLRQGNMYRLPFDDAEFNTIILDDVLSGADDPIHALCESRRLLKRGGRLFILQGVSEDNINRMQHSLAEWSAAADLRLAPAQFVPTKEPMWLLSVATVADSKDKAA